MLSCRSTIVQNARDQLGDALNNILEQDHRFIKRITGSMLGFKAFHSAAATLAGIETAHMIRKGQFGSHGATAFERFAALAG